MVLSRIEQVRALAERPSPSPTGGQREQQGGKLAVMRKRLFTATPLGIRLDDASWLDLDRAASVEVTSEEKDYGIEAALVSGETQGGVQLTRDSNDPTTLRSGTKAQMHLAHFRGNRDSAYPRVRLAMVCGWRKLVSRNCEAAVEFQPT